MENISLDIIEIAQDVCANLTELINKQSEDRIKEILNPSSENLIQIRDAIRMGIREDL